MELISTKICKTSDIGVNDNLFGGTMLSWLDEAGAIMSCDKINSKSVVTLKIEEVLFKLPVKVNDHIKIYGEIIKVGNSSLTLKLEARKRNFNESQKETPVCSTNVVFVQIDADSHSLKFTEEQLKNIK